MFYRFACCILVRLIIYVNEFTYLLNRSNPQPLRVQNHSKAINIDKIVADHFIKNCYTMQ